LVDKTKNFVGSEIEEAVRAAINQAFFARQSKVPLFGELFDIVSGTLSLHSLNPESVTKMAEFAKNRARSVRTKLTAKTPNVKPTRRISNAN
jgi:hypothetical protein